jgi:hypothetical protein
MPNDITFTQSSNTNAIPLQNLTLFVTPSSNFGATSYLYQWKAGGTNITGATAATYKFNASSTAGSTTYTCAVSGLTGSNVFVYGETSANIVVTVAADTTIFSRHLPKNSNVLNETGYERYMRIRNLGYC